MPIFHLELNWKLTHTSQPEKDTNDTAGSEFTPNIKVQNLRKYKMFQLQIWILVQHDNSKEKNIKNQNIH